MVRLEEMQEAMFVTIYNNKNRGYSFVMKGACILKDIYDSLIIRNYDVTDYT